VLSFQAILLKHDIARYFRFLSKFVRFTFERKLSTFKVSQLTDEQNQKLNI